MFDFIYCVCRYWDDGTPTSTRPRSKNRHYVMRNDRKQVPLVPWAKFLDLWSVSDLNIASRILRAGCYHDWTEEEAQFLQLLRKDYAELLLLNPDDPLEKYQDQLAKAPPQAWHS